MQHLVIPEVAGPVKKDFSLASTSDSPTEPRFWLSGITHLGVISFPLMERIRNLDLLFLFLRIILSALFEASGYHIV